MQGVKPVSCAFFSIVSFSVLMMPYSDGPNKSFMIIVIMVRSFGEMLQADGRVGVEKK